MHNEITDKAYRAACMILLATLAVAAVSVAYSSMVTARYSEVTARETARMRLTLDEAYEQGR